MPSFSRTLLPVAADDCALAYPTAATPNDVSMGRCFKMESATPSFVLGRRQIAKRCVFFGLFSMQCSAFFSNAHFVGITRVRSTLSAINTFTYFPPFFALSLCSI